MKNVPGRILIAVTMAALLAISITSVAKARTPTREGNIWDWRNHQPTETQVDRKERAAGVAPSASERAATETAENDLAQRLLNDGRESPGTIGEGGLIEGRTGLEPNSPQR